MFPNLINSVRSAIDNVAQDVSRQFHGTTDSNSNTRAPSWADFPGIGQPFGMPSQPQQQQQQQQPQNRRAPPASTRAIRQLPTIRVAPEDLIDPSNRECCVCLEDNNLDDIVTRMPCAHIFHTHCILDWLSHHGCTCPVCRYELATDDPQYEAGRMERMKARKPRFAMHELKRLTVQDLLELNRRPIAAPKSFVAMEKAELIQMLIDQGKIDIIPTPNPVEYNLETLKRMKIGELKRTMNDNGVYFRPEDVVEKSDMLAIFQNSGRLILTGEETDPWTEFAAASTSDASFASQPATTISSPSSTTSPNQSLTGHPGPLPTVETVAEESEDEAEKKSKGGNSVTISPSAEVLFAQQEENFSTTHQVQQKQRQTKNGKHSHGPSTEGNTRVAQTESDSQNATTIEPQPAIASLLPNERQHDPGNSQNTQLNHSQSTDPLDIDDEVPILFPHLQSGTYSDTADQPDHPSATFENYTIQQLQTLAQDTNIDLSSCFERREMVNLFVNAGIRGTADPAALSPQMFSTWTVSQLRAVASEANIDLSRCVDRDAMVERILLESNSDRQYLREYLRTLSPLTRSSLSELRTIARDLQVDISDCLEKDEIIQRLITRGQRYNRSR